MTGNACIQAAERARDVIASHAARKLDLPVERLAFADRRVFDVADPAHGLAFAEAVQLAEAAEGTIGTVGSYTPAPSPGKYRGAGVGPSPAYSYSACVARVDVDPASGIVRVPRVWIAHDVGRSINAATVMGQIEGSVYMRSEEHTSELQSQSNLVCRLLLEKKKKNQNRQNTYTVIQLLRHVPCTTYLTA